MFFGADSSNPDVRLYENMGDVMLNIDVFCIGMECVGAPYTWLYGALHTRTVSKAIMNSRRLNGSDSKQAFDTVNLVRPRQVYIYRLIIDALQPPRNLIAGAGLGRGRLRDSPSRVGWLASMPSAIKIAASGHHGA